MVETARCWGVCIPRGICGTCDADDTTEFRSILQVISKRVSDEIKRITKDWGSDWEKIDYSAVENCWDLTDEYLRRASDVVLLWESDNLSYKDIWSRQLASRLAKDFHVSSWRNLASWYQSGEWRSAEENFNINKHYRYLVSTLIAVHIVFAVQAYTELCVDHKGNLCPRNVFKNPTETDV